MHRKSITLGIVILFTITGLTGCVENHDPSEEIDLSAVKLTVDDLHKEYQKIDERHTTEPYIVEEGKMFEGWKVYEKYEVLFFNDTAVFIIQQLARLQSQQACIEFIETLQTKTSLSGITGDWNFSDVDMETIGDGSLLKKNRTVMNGEEVDIYMLVFRMNNMITILVTGSIPIDDIIEYGTIIENRARSMLTHQG